MGLESLGKKLAQLGSDTRSSVRKMNESYQIGNKIAEEKKTLSRLYKSIGEAVFQADPEHAPEGLEEEYEAIRSTKAALEELEAQKTRMRGFVICPECGREAPLNENYCSACGAKLPDIAPKEEEEAQPAQEDAAEEEPDDADYFDEEIAKEGEDMPLEESAVRISLEKEKEEQSPDRMSVEDDTASVEDNETDAGSGEVSDSEDAGIPSGEEQEIREDFEQAQDRFVESAKAVAAQAGEVIDEMAERARDLMGIFTKRADAFVKDVSSRMTAETRPASEEKAADEEKEEASQETEKQEGTKEERRAALEKEAQEAIAKAAKTAAEFAKEAQKMMKEAVEKAREAAEKYKKEAEKQEAEDAVKAAQEAGEAVRAAAEDTVDAAEEIAGEAVDAAEEIAGEAVQTAEDMVEAADEAAKEAAEAVTQAAEETGEAIKEAAGEAAQSVDETLEDAADAFTQASDAADPEE